MSGSGSFNIWELFADFFWDTCRTVCAIALHHKTNTNTSPNPDPNRYRRAVLTLIQKFIHYMAPTPQWVVLQNSMRVEFAHTHLHTTHFLVLILIAPLLLRYRITYRIGPPQGTGSARRVMQT